MREVSLAQQRETLPRSRWAWSPGEEGHGVRIVARIRAETPVRERYEIQYGCCSRVVVVTQRQLALRFAGQKGDLCQVCAARAGKTAAQFDAAAWTAADSRRQRAVSSAEWRLFVAWHRAVSGGRAPC